MAEAQKQGAEKSESAKLAPPKRGLIAALVAARGELGLDTASASLALAHFIVAKGEAWYEAVTAPQLVAEATSFMRTNPVAWGALVQGNVMGLMRGLEMYGLEHDAPEEYSRRAAGLAAQGA